MKNSLLIIFLLFNSMCVKRTPIPDSMPEATTNGANTFGCRINDDIFIPESGGFSKESYPISWNFPYEPWNFLKLYTSRFTNNKKDPTNRSKVAFELEGITSTGVYSLKFGKVSYQYATYYLDTVNSSNEITITKLDTSAKIISGTFSFNAFSNDKSNKMVLVSDGRFDLKQDTK